MTMREINKKRSFTLLELMICLTILTLAAGLFGWQIKDMIAQHQFKSSSQKLFCHLQQLQTLALTHQVDIQVELSEEKGSSICVSRTDEPALKAFNGLKITLPGITSLKKGKLTLFSSGRIDPPQALRLDHHDDHLWIDLLSPLQIKLLKTEPKSHPPTLPGKPEKTNRPLA